MASKPIIEYYFSFLSLWSYVGSLEFRAVAQRNNAQIIYKPCDILHIFSISGGKPVKQRATQRQAYRLVEMQRWRQIRQIPLVLHPKFYPADPSLAHRVLLAAIEEGSDVADFAHAGLKAVWADELDIADKSTIRRLADAAGLDGARLLRRAEEDPALREREAGLTTEAVQRQVFGAPFYFYRDEPFWGQDRLELLESTMKESREPIPLPNVAGSA